MNHQAQLKFDLALAASKAKVQARRTEAELELLEHYRRRSWRYTTKTGETIEEGKWYLSSLEDYGTGGMRYLYVEEIIPGAGILCRDNDGDLGFKAPMFFVREEDPHHQRERKTAAAKKREAKVAKAKRKARKRFFRKVRKFVDEWL